MEDAIATKVFFATEVTEDTEEKQKPGKVNWAERTNCSRTCAANFRDYCS